MLTKNAITGKMETSYKLVVKNDVNIKNLTGHHEASKGSFDGKVCFGTCTLLILIWLIYNQ